MNVLSPQRMVIGAHAVVVLADFLFVIRPGHGAHRGTFPPRSRCCPNAGLPDSGRMIPHPASFRKSGKQRSYSIRNLEEYRELSRCAENEVGARKNLEQRGGGARRLRGA